MNENQPFENKINLPKTDFSMKANLAQKEPIKQKDWEKIDIYQQILAKNKNNSSYILHDGPPYANGHIHLGHSLNKVLKDFILKFEAMNGKYTPYIPGWDCHGLPIEYQLLKEMETDKNSVDQLKFRKKAAAFAEKHVKIQKEEFKRLGIFADWENPYLTLTPDYEGTIINIFKNLVNKGFVYRGLKPVYWCSSCETALAEAEVEYADHKSTSVFVKFPVTTEVAGFSNVSIIIWTTTPWTLPSNVAVAMNSEFDYSIFEVLSTENDNISVNEKFIVATDLLKSLAEKLKIQDYKILQSIKGKDLEHLKCKSPYRDELSVGILADYVTAEDGTGIVHIAPGHGEDDYLAGLKYNLPILAPVNAQGRFTSEVEKFQGKNIFEANPLIITDLHERKLLLKVQNIEHSYPHCWRCKNPVIFRATSQWFLKIDHDNLRQRIIDACKDVQWIPDYGYNRITSMIENRPDWCLSRQRLWGVPIPAFYCKDCGELLLTDESMSAIENAFREKGSDVWFYKSAQELLPENIKCKCGCRNFDKEKDILDVWFDSGVSAEAVLKARENLSWPADLYLEGSDQHRGWFQSSLIPSVALNGKPPYKTVLTHGFTVDGEGKKMSKSIGNVVSPHDIMNKYGADVLRLWIASENYREDMRISDNIIGQMVDAYRKIRNTAKYILGNLDCFDFDRDKVDYEEMLEVDKWALSELSIVSKKIISAFQNREFHIVYREFYNFCSVELSSLYFDILKDRLYVMSPNSLERKSAQTVLFYLASFLTRFIAPIMPFTAEEIWVSFGIKDKKESKSIFLENYPCMDTQEKDLLKIWEQDVEFSKKWSNIFTFRPVLLKKIEEKRLEHIIGNSLEAKVVITLEKEFPEVELFKGNEKFWTQIAIVSQVEIHVNDLPANVDLIDQSLLPENLRGNKISVSVTKADGQKCSRCWNWSTKITKMTDDHSLCDRCLDILKNW